MNQFGVREALRWRILRSSTGTEELGKLFLIVIVCMYLWCTVDRFYPEKKFKS